jgi:hypothetical protein
MATHFNNEFLYTPNNPPEISCLKFPVHNLNFPLPPCVLHSNSSAHTVNMKYIVQLDSLLILFVPTATVSVQQNLLRSEHMSSVNPNCTLVHLQRYDLRALWNCWFWPEISLHITPHSGYEILRQNLWALARYSPSKFHNLMFTYAKKKTSDMFMTRDLRMLSC